MAQDVLPTPSKTTLQITRGFPDTEAEIQAIYNIVGAQGGSASKPKKRSAVKWSSSYNMEGTPSWWQGLTPSRVTSTSGYLAIINAMIPYMSPEDQLSTLQSITTAYPKTDIGKSYAPAAAVETNNIPTEIAPETRNYYTSAERVKQAKQALEAMAGSIASKTGKSAAKVQKSLGTGYQYLNDVLNVIEKFSGASGRENQTRSQYEQMLAQLDPLLEMGKSQGYSTYSIAKSLAQPYFTAGSTTETTKDASGVARYGAANPKRF